MPIRGMDATDQVAIDKALIELDGTPNKARLGANAILGVSLAVAKAAGAVYWPAALPLHRRNAGPRAARADDEHHQRRGARGQSDRLPGIHDHAGRRRDASADAVRMGSEVFHTLRKALEDAGHNTNVGDEGGFAPNLSSAEDALDFIDALDRDGRVQARRGHRAGARLRRHGVLQGRRSTVYEGEGQVREPQAQAEYLAGLVGSYPIVSIEDGMSEDDWEGWKLLTELVGKRCQLVGDDLFVTNVDRLSTGHRPEGSPIPSWSR